MLSGSYSSSLALDNPPYQNRITQVPSHKYTCNTTFGRQWSDVSAKIRSSAVERETAAKKNSAALRFQTFCTRAGSNLDDLLRTASRSEQDRLHVSRHLEYLGELFVTWLVMETGVEVETAFTYLHSAVYLYECHHRISLRDPTWTSIRLTKRSLLDRFPPTPNVKEPIVQQHLLDWLHLQWFRPDSDDVHLLYFTAALTLWTAALRPNDILPKSKNFNSKVNATRSDLSFFPNHMSPSHASLVIRGFKTRKFCKRKNIEWKPKILPFMTSSPICAAAFLLKYLQKFPCPSHLGPKSCPLFFHKNGSPLTTANMLDFTHKMMSHTGSRGPMYGASSYRSGGATAASAVKGVTPNQLLNMGMWVSNANLRYTRATEAPTLSVIRAMITTRSTPLIEDVGRPSLPRRPNKRLLNQPRTQYM